MFSWDSEKSSKKLSIDEDELTIKVKDGSGFKTSVGDQVTILILTFFFYSHSKKGEDTISRFNSIKAI
jgi:hypothetical protein